STVMIGAQEPTDETAAPNETAEATPADTPAVRSFTIEVTEAEAEGEEGQATTADVQLSVESNNFEISTETPQEGNGDETARGMLKYCYDMPMASPGATGAGSPTMMASQEATAAETGMPEATGAEAGSS